MEKFFPFICLYKEAQELLGLLHTIKIYFKTLIKKNSSGLCPGVSDFTSPLERSKPQNRFWMAKYNPEFSGDGFGLQAKMEPS